MNEIILPKDKNSVKSLAGISFIREYAGSLISDNKVSENISFAQIENIEVRMKLVINESLSAFFDRQEVSFRT